MSRGPLGSVAERGERGRDWPPTGGACVSGSYSSSGQRGREARRRRYRRPCIPMMGGMEPTHCCLPARGRRNGGEALGLRRRGGRDRGATGGGGTGCYGQGKIGEVVEKLPQVIAVTEEVRGARELACSPRPMELRSGGASVDLEHWSSLSHNGVVEASIEVLEERCEGAGARWRPIYRPTTVHHAGVCRWFHRGHWRGRESSGSIPRCADVV